MENYDFLEKWHFAMTHFFIQIINIYYIEKLFFDGIQFTKISSSSNFKLWIIYDLKTAKDFIWSKYCQNSYKIESKRVSKLSPK